MTLLIYEIKFLIALNFNNPQIQVSMRIFKSDFFHLFNKERVWFFSLQLSLEARTDAPVVRFVLSFSGFLFVSSRLDCSLCVASFLLIKTSFWKCFKVRLVFFFVFKFLLNEIVVIMGTSSRTLSLCDDKRILREVMLSRLNTSDFVQTYIFVRRVNQVSNVWIFCE